MIKPQTTLSFLLLLLSASPSFAQHDYIRKCEGVWTGRMYMYKWGALRDSVDIKLTISPETAEAWTWKTEYFSSTMPMTKDYKLRVKDASKHVYVTDEGKGVELTTYQNGAKLYNVFETGGFLLTSTYECTGSSVTFEVSSGKQEAATHPDIKNFSVDFLQRAVLKRL